MKYSKCALGGIGAVGESRWIGPFLISDSLKAEELRRMHEWALEAYAGWNKGNVYPRSAYRQAYTYIEKIAKKKGVKI